MLHADGVETVASAAGRNTSSNPGSLLWPLKQSQTETRLWLTNFDIPSRPFKCGKQDRVRRSRCP
ncbi:MAG: hypothetical protein DWQ08_15055 [Proteobacteria bacterium]|nr:MAG: hypothetical protein DWQ08_15055 [Pseudomonadota bacterium]